MQPVLLKWMILERWWEDLGLQHDHLESHLPTYNLFTFAGGQYIAFKRKLDHQGKILSIEIFQIFQIFVKPLCLVGIVEISFLCGDDESSQTSFSAQTFVLESWYIDVHIFCRCPHASCWGVDASGSRKTGISIKKNRPEVPASFRICAPGGWHLQKQFRIRDSRPSSFLEDETKTSLDSSNQHAVLDFLCSCFLNDTTRSVLVTGRNLVAWSDLSFFIRETWPADFCHKFRRKGRPHVYSRQPMNDSSLGSMGSDNTLCASEVIQMDIDQMGLQVKFNSSKFCLFPMHVISIRCCIHAFTRLKIGNNKKVLGCLTNASIFFFRWSALQKSGKSTLQKLSSVCAAQCRFYIVDFV